MKNKDLLKRIAGETGLTPVDVDNALTSLRGAIVDTLKANGKCEIHGLAYYQVKHKAERNGRNPATGESIIIPAHDVVTVKATSIQSEVVG